jgi:hypothetical protein
MLWLFNKIGVVTVLGALLLILAIYLIRASGVWQDKPEPPTSSDQRQPARP